MLKFDQAVATVLSDVLVADSPKFTSWFTDIV